MNTPASEKAKYAADAVWSDQHSHTIKAELDRETKVQDVPITDEPAVPAAELEKHTRTAFQLQTLLKDAGRKMLESSVEQGVSLLDQMKVPLLEKMENNADAEQWIQQIDILKKQAGKTSKPTSQNIIFFS